MRRRARRGTSALRLHPRASSTLLYRASSKPRRRRLPMRPPQASPCGHPRPRRPSRRRLWNPPARRQPRPRRALGRSWAKQKRQPYAPAPSEPVWTPAPAPAEPATPVEPARPAAAAASPGAWSVVGEAKESAATVEPQPKKKKGKEQEAAPSGSWTLASGNAPGDEPEEGAVKPPGQAVAVAQYAVIVVGLLAVLIGVLIMVAGSGVK